MNSYLRAKVTKLRGEISDRFLEFKPYISTIELDPEPVRFFFGTPQAVDWYDPLQSHTRIELEWMAGRVRGHTEKIIDAGAYHGLYSVVLGKAAGAGSEVIAVDPVPSNCALIEANLRLNDLPVNIAPCAVARDDGSILLSRGSCGRIVQQGGIERPARRLSSFMSNATVVKVDIEGEEFSIFPEQLDAMPQVHTWNVEIHPGKGREPGLLLDAFVSRGYTLYWVNRDSCTIERYPLEQAWTTRTSFIAIRT